MADERAATHVIARIVGGPSIVIAHEPGTQGADSPAARWWPGRVVDLLDDNLRVHRVRCIDWFQPFGDPKLTIYTFTRPLPPQKAEGT